MLWSTVKSWNPVAPHLMLPELYNLASVPQVFGLGNGLAGLWLWLDDWRWCCGFWSVRLLGLPAQQPCRLELPGWGKELVSWLGVSSYWTIFTKGTRKPQEKPSFDKAFPKSQNGKGIPDSSMLEAFLLKAIHVVFDNLNISITKMCQWARSGCKPLITPHALNLTASSHAFDASLTAPPEAF